jgi:nucleoside-diphosphate-sugar epimerase
MRILVTGGAGFIGSRLMHALVAKDHEVVAFDDLSGPGSWNAVRDLASRATLVEGDIRRQEDLARLPPGPWDRVYHLAASFANARSLHDPETDRSVNAGGTEMVLAHARSRGTGLFVYTGSSSSYGDLPPPFREDSESRPHTPYARSKLAGERLVQASGIPFAVLRLFNVYGPGDPPGQWRNAIPNMALAISQTGKVPLLGGSATRDFTFVDDVVAVMLRADRAAGLVVNVGTGHDTAMRGVAEGMLRILDRPSDCIDEKPSRPWDTVERRVADTSRLRECFGSVPSTPFPQGLFATLEWLFEMKYISLRPR